MYIYCVDDNPLGLTRAKELVQLACKEKKLKNFEIVECRDGAELIQNVRDNEPSMILLDINMPVMDGLTALVKLRNRKIKAKIIMISSENFSVVGRFKTGQRSEIDDEKKKELLQKVVDRIRSDNEEGGKINSVLEACGNLGLDPVQVARDLGADEFIQKPYAPKESYTVLVKLMTASMLLN